MDLGALVYNIQAQNQEFKRRMDENKGKIKDVDSQAQKNIQTMRKWSAAITAASVGIIAAFNRMASSAADTAEQLDRLSIQTGIAHDRVAALGYAAEQELASMEQLSTALTRMTRNMQDAARGTGEAARAFEELDIEVVNADGSLRNAEDVFLEVADRFVNMEDHANRTAHAMNLFGRAGRELVPLLSLGRDGIEELTEEAERLGIAMDEEQVQGLREWKDTMDAFRAGLRGFTQQIATDVIPLLQRGADWLQRLAEWINAIPEPLRRSVAQATLFAAGLGAIVGPLGLIVSYLPRVAAGLSMMKAGFLPFLPKAAIAMGLIAIVGYIRDIGREARLTTQDIDAMTDAFEVQEEMVRVKREIETAMGDIARIIREESEEFFKETGIDPEILDNIQLLQKLAEETQTVTEEGKEAWGELSSAQRSRLEEMYEDAQVIFSSLTRQQRELVVARLEDLDELEKKEEELREKELVGAERAILEKMREKRAKYELGKKSLEDYIAFLQKHVDNEEWSAETRLAFQRELDRLKLESHEETIMEMLAITEDYLRRKELLGKEGLDKEITRLEQEREAALEAAKASAEEEEATEEALEKAKETINAYYDTRVQEARKEHADNILEIEERLERDLALLREKGMEQELLRMDQRRDAEIEDARDIAETSEEFMRLRSLIVEKYEEEKEQIRQRYRDQHEAEEQRLLERVKQFEMEDYEFQQWKLEQERDAYLEAGLDRVNVMKWYLGASRELREEYFAGLQEDRDQESEEQKQARQKELAEDRRLMRAKAEVDDEYLDDYIQLLKTQLEEYEKFSEEWMEIWREMQLDATRDQFEDFYSVIEDGFTRAITAGKDFQEVLRRMLDQLAEMAIRQFIIQPAMQFVGLTAHKGGLITPQGLVQDIPSYHSGGIAPDEQIIKAQTGERILSRGQNEMFEQMLQSAQPHITINAIDAKSFSDRLRDHKGEIEGISIESLRNHSAMRELIRRLDK